ncbi:MAG: GNAT family N-acetyltransferase [Fimbriimonadaceae bacterium]
MPFRISTGIENIDFPKLRNWLAEAYWSKLRTEEVIIKSLDNSDCFTAHLGDEMVGFARVVSDRATFAWLCDVYVDPGHRGTGVSRALMDAIMTHPDYATARWLLGTRDAHGLYEKYGFVTSTEPDRWMTKGFRDRFEP